MNVDTIVLCSNSDESSTWKAKSGAEVGADDLVLIIIIAWVTLLLFRCQELTFYVKYICASGLIYEPVVTSCLVFLCFEMC